LKHLFLQIKAECYDHLVLCYVEVLNIILEFQLNPARGSLVTAGERNIHFKNFFKTFANLANIVNLNQFNSVKKFTIRKIS